MTEIELPDWVLQSMLRPQLESARRENWLRARELGGRPDLEWAHAVNVMRGNVLMHPVRSQFYEYLSTWEEVVTALRVAAILGEHIEPDIGVHVGLGFEVFDGVFSARHGRLSIPLPDDRYRGRHWTWQVVEHDEDTLRFLNTWGRDWGLDGWGYISRDYFEAHVDAALVQRPAYTGSSPDMDRALREALWRIGKPGGFDPGAWAKSWREPNPRRTGEVDVNGTTYTRWRRLVFSLKEDWPAAHVYDLVQDEDTLVGRFHLIESRSRGDALLEELWVVPERRRQGVGAVLERQATSLGRWLGAPGLIAPLFEADDAAPGGRSAFEALARSGGYDIDWRRTRRPNTVAAARKALK